MQCNLSYLLYTSSLSCKLSLGFLFLFFKYFLKNGWDDVCKWCASVVMNGELVAQGSRFSRIDVEVVIAVVDLTSKRWFTESGFFCIEFPRKVLKALFTTLTNSSPAEKHSTGCTFTSFLITEWGTLIPISALDLAVWKTKRMFSSPWQSIGNAGCRSQGFNKQPQRASQSRASH